MLLQQLSKAIRDRTRVITFAFTLRSQTGTTALFFAAQGGYMDIASLLLEHGAVVDSCSIVSRRKWLLARMRNVIPLLTCTTWISGRRHAALRRMPIRSFGRRGGLDRERRQSECSYEGKKTRSKSIYLPITTLCIRLKELKIRSTRRKFYINLY